jgi:TRAP-type C4-dicarboxylate transport system permease large subunit
MMTGMIFILIIGATVFSRFLVICEVPSSLATFIGGLEVPRIFVLITVLITYVLLGCIMDLMSILIVAVPILHPMLVELGFNPLWLAVLTVITVLIGNVTPPVGIVAFALYGMVKDTSLFTIFRDVVPFIITMIICLIILIAFPQIATWLPGMMGSG